MLYLLMSKNPIRRVKRRRFRTNVMTDKELGGGTGDSVPWVNLSRQEVSRDFDWRG
jgi:hypothetical protein